MKTLKMFTDQVRLMKAGVGMFEAERKVLALNDSNTIQKYVMVIAFVSASIGAAAASVGTIMVIRM